MGNVSLHIVVDDYTRNALDIISRKYPLWYIDGTLYNSGSGMNFSCAGLKADCIAVNFSIEKEEWLNSEQIKTYISENGSERSFPNDMRILINRDYKNSLLVEADNRILKIIILEAESEPPLLYLLVK